MVSGGFCRSSSLFLVLIPAPNVSEVVTRQSRQAGLSSSENHGFNLSFSTRTISELQQTFSFSSHVLLL